MKTIILIPARMASTRLPNKPLADIAGLPMIVRVMQQAQATGLDVLVATDSDEIKAVIEAHNGKVVMTAADHPSGTDRIAQALELFDPQREYDTVINVQGDLPTIDPDIIHQVLQPLKTGKYAMATLVTTITDKAEITNPNVVKPVITWEAEKQGRAHYFSREAVPHNAHTYYHHIGLYAYSRDVLQQLVALPASPLEKSEKLEQLRAIEVGIPIAVTCVDTVPLGVDTEEDLIKARTYYE